MANKHVNSSESTHVLRNCLVHSSLKYYPLESDRNFRHLCLALFWFQEHRAKLFRSIWSCLESCEEFHQTKQIIPDFKIDPKGAADDSVHIKGSSDAFDRMNHCCKTILYENQLPLHANGSDVCIEKMLMLFFCSAGGMNAEGGEWGKPRLSGIKDIVSMVWAPYTSIVHVNSLNLWTCQSAFPNPPFFFLWLTPNSFLGSGGSMA